MRTRPILPTSATGLSLGLALFVLLALPVTVLAQTGPGWTAFQGDAQHSGYARLAEGPLDLVATLDLLEQDLITQVQAPVVTPHGVYMGVSELDSVACHVARLGTSELAVTERTEIPTCEAAWIAAYHPGMDLLFLCGDADDPDGEVLTAVEAGTLEVRWAKTAAELLDSDARQGLAPGATSQTGAFCRDLVVAPDGQHVAVLTVAEDDVQGDALTGLAPSITISLVDAADGERVWRQGISGAASPATCRPLNLCDQLTGANIGPTVTATTGGPVVTYYAPCAPCQLERAAVDPDSVAFQGAVAWFTWEGTFRGALRAEDLSEPGPDFLRWGPNWATASGPLAAVPLGGHLLMINPNQDQPVRQAPFSGVDAATGYYGIPGPAWWGETLLVPLSASVTRFDPDDLTRPVWSWTPGLEWPLNGSVDVYGTVIAWPSDVLVVAGDEVGGEPSELRVYRLDQATGESLQWIELPGGREGAQGDTNAAITVLDDGRVILFDRGDFKLHLLAPSEPDRRPGVELATTVPGSGETFTLTPSAPAAGPATTLRVFWGDGTSTEAQPGQAVPHAYPTQGQRTLRVTAVFPDGTTATTETTVDVGGQALNPLQEAFAPENQDITFGVLGIVVAVTGGAIGIARSRRKRSRLQAELDRLQEAYEATHHQPKRCEEALQAAKMRARRLLLDGKLDEGQGVVLRDRAEELGRQLRVHTLDERFQFLPHGMVLALQDMLADGQISAWEREHVLRALAEDDVLSPEQKQAVAAQIDAWFERDRRSTGQA